MTRRIGQEMIDGLGELARALSRGDDISQKFNVRKVTLAVKPADYTPAMVKKTRKSLNASQSLFAIFLGVSPATVRAWERGANAPSDLASRFMDEIRHDPAYWRTRFSSLARVRMTEAHSSGRAPRR